MRRRELESRVLLGLVAAERGHDVLVGDLRQLLSHRLWLKPGLYHDKGLAPKASKIRLYELLARAGFVLSSQDEEHGLGDPDYQSFAERRFDDRTLSHASVVCCWGPHDRNALVKMYPSHASKFMLTGSPRTDLWRSTLSGRHSATSAAAMPDRRPYILVTPGSRPFIPHPFWTAMSDFRARQFRSLDDEREWKHYEQFSEAYRYVGRLIRLMRRAADQVPEICFVVRPHPKSPEGAWEGVLGDMPNARVDRRGDSLGRVANSALALLHNGSTSAAEGCLLGVPIISYQPHNERADRFTNRLGTVVQDDSQFFARVRELLVSSSGRAKRNPIQSDINVLEERLYMDQERLNADLIVDAWEVHASPRLNGPNRLRQSLLAAAAHHSIARRRTPTSRRRGTQRDRTQSGIDEKPKFPPLNDEEVKTMVQGFKSSLRRFDDVEALLLSPHLLRLRPTASAAPTR